MLNEAIALWCSDQKWANIEHATALLLEMVLLLRSKISRHQCHLLYKCFFKIFFCLSTNRLNQYSFLLHFLWRWSATRLITIDRTQIRDCATFAFHVMEKALDSSISNLLKFFEVFELGRFCKAHLENIVKLANAISKASKSPSKLLLFLIS